MNCDNSESERTIRLISILIAIVIVIIASWVGFIQYNSKSHNEVMLELAEKNNLHPAVIECLNSKNWAIVSDFEMCRLIFAGANLTIEDAQKLRNDLR